MQGEGSGVFLLFLVASGFLSRESGTRGGKVFLAARFGRELCKSRSGAAATNLPVWAALVAGDEDEKPNNRTSAIQSGLGRRGLFKPALARQTVGEDVAREGGRAQTTRRVGRWYMIYRI